MNLILLIVKYYFFLPVCLHLHITAGGTRIYISRCRRCCPYGFVYIYIFNLKSDLKHVTTLYLYLQLYVGMLLFWNICNKIIEILNALKVLSKTDGTRRIMNSRRALFTVAFGESI